MTQISRIHNAWNPFISLLAASTAEQGQWKTSSCNPTEFWTAAHDPHQQQDKLAAAGFPAGCFPHLGAGLGADLGKIDGTNAWCCLAIGVAGHRTTMVVALQNQSGILNSTTGINAAEPRHMLAQKSF